jgi:hypothetical protein
MSATDFSPRARLQRIVAEFRSRGLSSSQISGLLDAAAYVVEAEGRQLEAAETLVRSSYKVLAEVLGLETGVPAPQPLENAERALVLDLAAVLEAHGAELVVPGPGLAFVNFRRFASTLDIFDVSDAVREWEALGAVPIRAEESAGRDSSDG